MKSFAKKRFVALLVVCSVLLVTFAAANGAFRADASHGRRAEIAAPSTQASTQGEWSLIVVNSHFCLPDDYEIELTTLRNGEKVDSRIYPALQQMFEDMRADGFSPTVVSGYRTADKQQELLDNKIDAFVDEGEDEDDAVEHALSLVAIPGTSEHQLGLAVDINELGAEQTNAEFYDWLAANAHKYGFIQRYTWDKSDITGISNEPWHYRFVGVENAAKIVSRGVCLEEYVGLADDY